MAKSKKPTKAKGVTAIASWYGTNRNLATYVGLALKDCTHVNVGMAGSMCELHYIDARTINVNDIHPHLMNLARVIADPALGPQLYRRLRRTAFCDQSLKASQQVCKLVEETIKRQRDPVDFSSWGATSMCDWAYHYFVCSWMPRHGAAGTKNEFRTGLSVRWNAGGGDSAKHFFGAVRATVQMRRTFQRCNFFNMDVFDFLGNVKDEMGSGVYIDATFPGAGDAYKFSLTPTQHEQLATDLQRFTETRVVLRFYDHPMIRRLYASKKEYADLTHPELGKWHWHYLIGGKKQTNADAPEVLISNHVLNLPKATVPLESIA